MEKILNSGKVVIRSNADDLNGVFMVPSELLDVWRMAQTGDSIGGPIPQHHWSVSRYDLLQRSDGPGAPVEDLR